MKPPSVVGRLALDLAGAVHIVYSVLAIGLSCIVFREVNDGRWDSIILMLGVALLALGALQAVTAAWLLKRRLPGWVLAVLTNVGVACFLRTDLVVVGAFGVVALVILLVGFRAIEREA